MADERRKELGESKSPRAQIIPTLEAFSNYYLDYLKKPKEKEDKRKRAAKVG